MSASWGRICCHKVNQIGEENYVTSQAMFSDAQVQNSRTGFPCIAGG